MHYRGVGSLQERIIDHGEASDGVLTYGLSRRLDKSLYPQLDHTQQFAKVRTVIYTDHSSDDYDEDKNIEKKHSLRFYTGYLTLTLHSSKCNVSLQL